MKEIIPIFLDSMCAVRTNYRQSDLWEGFPITWRITREGLASNEGVMVRIWFEGFMDWIIHKIHNPGIGSEENVEDVVRHLFPDIDPALFLRALIVMYVLYGESKARALVETDWSFGFGHVIHPGTKSAQERYAKNTVLFLRSMETFKTHLPASHIRSLRADLSKYARKQVVPNEQKIRARKVVELLDHLLKPKK